MACGCGGPCCDGAWIDQVTGGAGTSELTHTEGHRNGTVDTGTPGSSGEVTTTTAGPTPVTPQLLEWLTDWWPLALAIGYVVWRSR